MKGISDKIQQRISELATEQTIREIKEVAQSLLSQSVETLSELKSTTTDMVNHPAHYNFSIKPVEAIESWGLNFNRGCIVKYASRAGRKSKETEIEDLKKIVFYATREIERLSSK